MGRTGGSNEEAGWGGTEARNGEAREGETGGANEGGRAGEVREVRMREHGWWRYGGTSGEGTGGGGTGGTGGEPPDPSVALQDRLVTTTVATPEGVKAGVSNWRIWGKSSLHIAPVFTIPLANCQTLVGYTTAAGSSLTPRVVRLDADDKPVEKYTLSAARSCEVCGGAGRAFGALLGMTRPTVFRWFV